MAKQNERKFEECFKFYEKAIEGRNFHYQNYNVWANYYSIFVGALFVAYYTIYNKPEICSNEPKIDFLKFLIAIIGFVTSICWNLAVKGHYHWMISWIRIVQDYEEEISKLSKESEEWFVYSVHKNDIKSTFDQENISTQKITSKFTFVICCAWASISIKGMKEIVVYFFECNGSCSWSLSIIVVFVIWFVVYEIFKKPSDISMMKSDIKKCSVSAP